MKSQLNRTEIVIRPAILQDINKATKDLNRIEKKKGLSVVDEVDGITAKPVQAKETKKRKAVPTGEENSKSKFILSYLKPNHTSEFPNHPL